MVTLSSHGVLGMSALHTNACCKSFYTIGQQPCR